MKDKLVTRYDLEEYKGTWEIYKQFDSKEEAEQELEFCKRFYNSPKGYRIVERTYKILFEAK